MHPMVEKEGARGSLAWHPLFHPYIRRGPPSPITHLISPIFHLSFHFQIPLGRSSVVQSNLEWELVSSRAKLGSPELSSGESGIALVPFLLYYILYINIVFLHFTKYLLQVFILSIAQCITILVVVLCLSLIRVVALVRLVSSTPCVCSTTIRGFGYLRDS